MNRRFLITLSALFVTAVLAFASLRGLLHAERTDSQQPIEPVRVAHREAESPRSRLETAPKETQSGLEISELSARIQQLQGQLDRLMRSAPSGGAEDVDNRAPLLPESEAEERQRTTQTTAFLHHGFTSEMKDPVWSLQAERQVSDAFNLDEISVGSQLQQLSCQATLCRIESHHSDENAERTFLTRLGRLESFANAEAFSERFERPDGSVEAVTYVSRSGHQLPRMAATD
jgi:hypothetical protein